jgi:hypothetical protein
VSDSVELKRNVAAMMLAGSIAAGIGIEIAIAIAIATSREAASRTG